MINLDKNYLLQQEQAYKQNKENKTNGIFPLKWLTTCGWDKISYDDYLTKYTAGTLDTNQRECFEIVYRVVLDIICTIEYLSAYKKIDYYFYKQALEAFAGSGLVSSKQQRTIQERVDKFKKQQELKNESGLEIK